MNIATLESTQRSLNPLGGTMHLCDAHGDGFLDRVAFLKWQPTIELSIGKTTFGPLILLF